MEKSVLSVKDLTVSFDGYKVVDNLSFDIGENELRVIIGPNGAGKTTVLDLISGKTKPTAGSVKFLGQEIMGVSENQIVKLALEESFKHRQFLRILRFLKIWRFHFLEEGMSLAHFFLSVIKRCWIERTKWQA
jgi:ABC-type uncharacterized transport system ATPase subunit